MKCFFTVLITINVLIVLGIVFIYSGIYNPSAASKEGGLAEWVLLTTKNNSIDARTKNLQVPDLSDTTLFREGFHHYDEMCVMCHGAPGVEESEVAKGLNPQPPALYKADEPEPREIFWAVKNGVKMTGMPSFGFTHSDEKIAAIAAFVSHKLPEMDANEYKLWKNESHHKHGSHEH